MFIFNLIFLVKTINGEVKISDKNITNISIWDDRLIESPLNI